MKKEQKRRTRITGRSIILSTAGFILVSFLTWFLVRFFTINTELELIDVYEFPETTLLQESFENEGGTFAIAIDGNIVAGNNNEVVRPTASTAKMILGLLIIEKKPFNSGETGETITISDEFYDRYIYYLYNNGSNTAVQIGEEISEYDALMSVFLASSNNMADSLAIWAFGSLEEYREYATNYLQSLGINNTTIGEDASGFSDTTTSTADDLAKIGNLVLENPVLKEIVKMDSYDVPVVGIIYNTNELLGIDRISGIKTGFIGDKSGYCLVSSYNEEEHRIAITVLNEATREDSFDKSLALVRKIQELVKPVNLVLEKQVIGYYDSWWTGRVPIYAEESLDEILYAEVEKTSGMEMGEEDGRLIVRIGDNNYSVNIKAEDYQKTPSFFDKVKRVFGWRKEDTEN